MSRKALENTNEICSCPPWASYNTPYIELIQYGRSICKKVYLHANFMLCECKWILFKNQLRKKTY